MMRGDFILNEREQNLIRSTAKDFDIDVEISDRRVFIFWSYWEYPNILNFEDEIRCKDLSEFVKGLGVLVDNFNMHTESDMLFKYIHEDYPDIESEIAGDSVVDSCRQYMITLDNFYGIVEDKARYYKYI